MLSVSEVNRSQELKKKSSCQAEQKQLRASYQLARSELENNENGLNRAFDILFEEVMKNRKKKLSTTVN